MIGNLGFGEILVIMLVVLLVFGAKRLPEVGASIGKGIREFKRSITETNDEIAGKDDAPPRQLDSQPPSSDGEPKRLSQ
ncbi:MAG: twin-arginine translocase TatA/TatE family subunit [Gemmatimonadales bacterium]